MADVGERLSGHGAPWRLRGLRPVELWVWDTASPEFQQQLRREAELVRAHAATAEGQAVQAFCDAAFDEMMEAVEAAEERVRAARG